jgi:hypothetical protein
MVNTYFMSTSKYQAVSDVLKAAQSQINVLLSDNEDELHRLHIVQVLQQQSNRILLITGTGDLSAQQTTTLGPARTIGGKPIEKVRRFAESDLVPADDKVYQLKKNVKSALLYFGPNASAEGILANIPELIIRGVAKKAGLQVTKDEPKELTVEFIDQIKVALLAKGLTKPFDPKGPLTEEEISLLGQNVKEVFKEAEDEKATQELEAVITVNDPLLETKEEPASEATKTFLDETIPTRTESKADPKKKQSGK